MMKLIAVILCAALAAGAPLARAANAQSVEKKTVRTADDLPRFTYPLAVAPSALLQSDPATFAAFAAPVGADVDAVLAGYDVRDHAALRALLAVKLDLKLLSGTQDAAALATARQIRALEDKPDAKLLSGLTTEAIVGARAETGATAGDAFRAAYARRYAAALAALPWSVAGPSLLQTKMSYEILTSTLMIGQVQGSLDPAAAKTHAIGNDTAAQIVRTRFTIECCCRSRTSMLRRSPRSSRRTTRRSRTSSRLATCVSQPGTGLRRCASRSGIRAATCGSFRATCIPIRAPAASMRTG